MVDNIGKSTGVEFTNLDVAGGKSIRAYTAANWENNIGKIRKFFCEAFGYVTKVEDANGKQYYVVNHSVKEAFKNQIDAHKYTDSSILAILKTETNGKLHAPTYVRSPVVSVTKDEEKVEVSKTKTFMETEKEEKEVLLTRMDVEHDDDVEISRPGQMSPVYGPSLAKDDDDMVKAARGRLEEVRGAPIDWSIKGKSVYALNEMRRELDEDGDDDALEQFEQDVLDAGFYFKKDGFVTMVKPKEIQE